ncbi:hypothetical protein FA743_09025 [Paracoccus gahaiensis]|uniref:Uncharacterized protein n=1 Tax=Paracoccus gahaiensis TaxID=1706839 RepID=A0A4U0RBT9_9RHOB|nr:hypothetical protein FA743_09025 [Paracoccus gahaiensis]
MRIAERVQEAFDLAEPHRARDVLAPQHRRRFARGRRRRLAALQPLDQKGGDPLGQQFGMFRIDLDHRKAVLPALRQPLRLRRTRPQRDQLRQAGAPGAGPVAGGKVQHADQGRGQVAFQKSVTDAGERRVNRNRIGKGHRTVPLF